MVEKEFVELISDLFLKTICTFYRFRRGFCDFGSNDDPSVIKRAKRSGYRDRIYQKITDKDEERWLLRAIDVSLLSFSEELSKI